MTVQKLGKIQTKVFVSRGGRVLEVVLPGKALNSLGEGLPWRTRGSEKTVTSLSLIYGTSKKLFNTLVNSRGPSDKNHPHIIGNRPSKIGNYH